MGMSIFGFNYVDIGQTLVWLVQIFVKSILSFIGIVFRSINYTYVLICFRKEMV